MPLKYLGRKRGFAQRTFTDTRPTPYLRNSIDIPTGLWRSPVTQDLIINDLKEFNNTTSAPVDDYIFQLAIYDARRAFKIEKTPMLHLNDVFLQKDLDIWNKSPGLPWRDIGYKTKGDIRRDPDAVRTVRKFWHLIKAGENLKPPDCCAFVRSHIAEFPKKKVRAIWGYPATMTFGEAVFALPLIQAYQKASSPIAYGYETMIGGMKRLVHEFNHTDVWYSAIDFKSFDKTVPSWLIETAFDILAENIDFLHYRDTGFADVRRNYRMFQYIKDYFINTTVRTAAGHRYRKNSGVASGSYFTQLVDSIVNYIIMVYVCYKLDLRLHKMKVLGDDSIFMTSRRPNIYKIAEIVDEVFGMRLNFDKSGISRQIAQLTFLGYKINDGTPTKEYNEWIAALVFPERPDKSWDDVASRALGLLYANSAVCGQFDRICRTIVLLKNFDLQLSASLQRMLTMIGVPKFVSTEPPDQFKLWSRLKLV